jgi:hypothetical protein
LLGFGSSPESLAWARQVAGGVIYDGDTLNNSFFLCWKA